VTGDLSAGERVQRGLQRLAAGCPLWFGNRNAPPVEPLFLDFTDPAHSLLAAIFGSHEIGLHLLNIAPEEAVSYGFMAADEADNAALRRLWAMCASSSRAEAASTASTSPLRPPC
jgi:hypothetical protein